MGLLDWLKARGNASRSEPSRRRLRGVESLEDRTNLSLPAEVPQADFSLDDTVQVDFSFTDFRDEDDQALETAQQVMDGYRSLLYQYQQDIPALAELESLEPDELLRQARSVVDEAISSMADLEFGRLDSEEGSQHAARATVREMQITLDEITLTVAELVEVESIRDILLAKSA